MTLEQRVVALEEKLKAIEQRHMDEDLETERVKSAMFHAAKKGIEDLSAKNSKALV